MDTSAKIKRSLSDEALALATLLRFFGVSYISFYSECWEYSKNNFSLQYNGEVDKQTSELIDDAAYKLIRHAYNKHLKDLSLDDDSGWSGSINLVGNAKLVVTVGYDYEEKNDSCIHIELGKVSPPEDGKGDSSDEDDSEIVKLLREHKVSEMSFRYSGSGDSGGTDEFTVSSEAGDIDSEVCKKLESLIEERVWNYTEACFDNDGSDGEAYLLIKDGLYVLEGIHNDMYQEWQGFDVSYPLNK